MPKMKLDNLFAQLGLEGLNDQKKLSMSEEWGKIALDRVATRFETLLTPEQMSKFETKLKTDEAAAFALLKEYLPDYSEIVREEIEQLRIEIVDTHTALKKKLGL